MFPFCVLSAGAMFVLGSAVVKKVIEKYNKNNHSSPSYSHSSYPHFPSHDAFVNTYTCASHWHHTGSLEEIPEQETTQEGELLHLRAHPDGGPVGGVFELPECPNHYPTTYVKGKPRSIAVLTYVS
jgi:hypothetical protein